jgi:5-deoxy-glucuronate isomerase
VSRHVFRRGATADAAFALSVGPEQAGWSFSGLRVLELAAGGAHAFETGGEELIVLPLAGGCTVACDGAAFELAGRSDPFAGPTDFAYVPPDARVEIASAGGGRFALPSARAECRLPARRVAAADVAVELRGNGSISRQVHNFCSAETFDAHRLMAVEVLTPAGNWSSYPPHKHDEDRPGEETVLEELYYYEPARDGWAFQRAYGDEIDVCVEVRSGDVVVMPSGYHGPTMAAPGYDLYTLHVMAGPGERAWRFSDDPQHAWTRESLARQPLDPRLPLAPGGRRG